MLYFHIIQTVVPTELHVKFGFDWPSGFRGGV